MVLNSGLSLYLEARKMERIGFNDRVAVVTGAGSGLGRAYAIELGRRGARVVVNDLGGSLDGTGGGSRAADSVVDEIKSSGGIAIANYNSVSTRDGGEGIVKAALDAFGRIDILINNAGILRDKTFLKMSEEDWDSVIDVHLKGAFYLTKAAYPSMRVNQYGRILFTSSISGLFGNFGQSNYGAAKAGLLGFMNVLKLEAAKYNITCNMIAPNAASRMTENLLPPEILRNLKPENVVPIVLYLCSDQCIDTGMTFVCGAGWFARTFMACTPGIKLEGTDGVVAVEDIAENWGRISSCDDARPYHGSGDVFGLMAQYFK